MKILNICMLIITFVVQASTDKSLIVSARREDAILYPLYDSMVNGVKGGAFAAVATPFSLGAYAVYANCVLVDILVRRFLLATSSATHFGYKARQEIERETAFREITNRAAKACISTTMVVYLISVVLTTTDIKSKTGHDA